MNKKTKIRFLVFVITVILTIVWSAYCLTNILLSDNNSNSKSVNISVDENNLLNENTKILLTEKDSSEKLVKTLAELKNDLNIDGNITKEKLDDILKKEGYQTNKDINEGSELVYNQKIKPNKYYIREYNGYLAIYKSNDNCDLFIEDEEEDVYLDAIKYDNFSASDKKYFEDYNAEYDNKDEARNYMTQFIS